MKKPEKEKILVIVNNDNDDYLKIAFYTNDTFNHYGWLKKNQKNQNIQVGKSISRSKF